MADNQTQETQSIQKLSPEVKRQAVDAARPSAQLMDRATANRSVSKADGTDQAGNREAMMHTQGATGKSQEALSPTDAQKSQTQTQSKSRERGRGMER